MPDVTLVTWSEDDLDLLRRSNTHELMDQLGGPEDDEQVRARHERYLRMWREGTGFQFRIVIPGHPEGVGTIGYWRRDEEGAPVLEAGFTLLGELDFEIRPGLILHTNDWVVELADRQLA